jgi:hypothetical protein
MRVILKLLLLAWFIWLIYRALISPSRKEQESVSGRKKVDSTVIKTKNHSDNCGDEKPQAYERKENFHQGNNNTGDTL